MGGTTLHLEKLTSPELDGLDRANTLFVLTMSPLEVHGPHLRFGTDVRVAEEIRDRSVEKLSTARPDLDFVFFPPYYAGSDTIPGSVEIASRALYDLVMGSGDFLADRGFKHALLVDNHGGPRHQIATARAVRKLFRDRGFRVAAPFLSFYKKMVENDPELLSRLQAGPGACGDAQDCHAGLNETSLVLRAEPDSVRPGWSELPRTSIDTRRWPAVLLGAAGRLLGAAGRLLGAAGLQEMARDLRYVGVMLSWVTEKNPPTYIGEPRAASAEAGERMLDAFSDEATRAVESILDGRPPFHEPLGWSLRFLQ